MHDCFFFWEGEFTAKTFCAYSLLYNYKRKKGGSYKRRKKKRGAIQATTENKTILYNIDNLLKNVLEKNIGKKSENETILYNIDKVLKNVLAKNRGKNKKKRIFIYFSFFVYGIALLYPYKRKKGEWIIE